jgi:tRNA synthetases class II (A)
MLRMFGARQQRGLQWKERLLWSDSHLTRLWRYEHSAAAVRSQFLDFFVKDKQHTFIRSSPVVPFNDPSLMFVNAGMNQFKSVLQVLE